MYAIVKQNQTIKANYPGALLLFRVGDYYESYGTDAELLSQQHGLMLSASMEEPLNVVVHFPLNCLEKHLRLFVRKGYKVAVCEPVADPKTCKTVRKRRSAG